MKRLLTGLIVALPLAGTTVSDGVSDGVVKRFVEDSRKASAQMLQQIGSELRKEVESSGPLRGIIVCKYTAPEVAATLSRHYGMRITRVSLKPRNPALGYPDPWEQKVLMDFDQRVSRGEPAAKLERWEVVSEPQGRFLRYMKAIPTARLCVSCHGPAEALSEAVKIQLASEYPHDRAVGFTEGMVRGAVAIKRPID